MSGTFPCLCARLVFGAIEQMQHTDCKHCCGVTPTSLVQRKAGEVLEPI